MTAKKNKTMGRNATLNITVLTWKDDDSIYFPDGEYRQINCAHVNEGNYGVNIRGESFPVSNNTNVPGNVTSPPTDTTEWQNQTAMVQEGNVYGPANPPFASTDPNYKLCTRIKDLQRNITSYVDAADYLTKIGSCNPAGATFP